MERDVLKGPSKALLRAALKRRLHAVCKPRDQGASKRLLVRVDGRF